MWRAEHNRASLAFSACVCVCAVVVGSRAGGVAPKKTDDPDEPVSFRKKDVVLGEVSEGGFFGEGALTSTQARRSASIKCTRLEYNMSSPTTPRTYIRYPTAALTFVVAPISFPRPSGNSMALHTTHIHTLPCAALTFCGCSPIFPPPQCE